MILNPNDERPIFLQVADGLEDEILSGVLSEEDQIPSITEFSVNYKINPATALKGINLLVQEGIIYKKRGLGMFVAQGAKEKLTEKRQKSFYDSYILPIKAEAKRLGISQDKLIDLIKRGE